MDIQIYNDFYARLGRIVAEINSKIGLQEPLLIGDALGANFVLGKYNTRRDLVTNLYQSYQGFTLSVQGWMSTLKTYSDRLITDLQAELNVEAADAITVLDAFIQESLRDQVLLDANNVTAAITDRLDIGNGELLYDVVNSDGYYDERGRDQKVSFICTADRHSGATEGGETFSVTGLPVKSEYSYEPFGSGGGAAMNVLDANTIVDNGTFDDWTDDQPDDWTVDNGENITQDVGHTNNFSAQLIGDGIVQKVKLSQELNLDVNTVYCMTAYIKTENEVPGTSLEVYIDGSGMERINLVNQDPYLIGDDYTLFNRFFVLPKDPADDLYLYVEWRGGGLLPAAMTVNVDNIVVGLATEYNHIQYAIAKGTTPFIRGDRFDVEVENDDAGLFQTYLIRYYDRFIPTRMPTSEATVSDPGTSQYSPVYPLAETSSITNIDDNLARYPESPSVASLSEVITTNATLTSEQIGKVIYVNSAANCTLTLPSIDNDNVGDIITIVKINTGAVRVQAADADIIVSSDTGGYAEETSGSNYSYIRLYVGNTWDTWLLDDSSGEWTYV